MKSSLIPIFKLNHDHPDYEFLTKDLYFKGSSEEILALVIPRPDQLYMELSAAEDLRALQSWLGPDLTLSLLNLTEPASEKDMLRHQRAQLTAQIAEIDVILNA